MAIVQAMTLSQPLASPPFCNLPGVWRADALGTASSQTQSTGYPVLDAQLPGGGWPVGAMCEVLQPWMSLHSWQLVLPGLAQLMARRAGLLVMVAPPCEPFSPALQAHGLAAHRLCLVRSTAAAPALWAAEQALRCRDVMAVMAWLPQVQPAALRRLQLAASQHQQLLWVFRPLSSAVQASPAVLRLQVRCLGAGPGESAGDSVHHSLQIQILKRRGPALLRTLTLPQCPPQLAQMLAAQAQRKRRVQTVVAQPLTSPSTASGLLPASVWGNAAVRSQEGQHALDRTAFAG